MTFAEIDVQAVEGWLESLVVNPTTRNNYRRNVSVFFEWGTKRGYCRTNPVASTEKAKEISERVEIFDLYEIGTILENAPPVLVPFFAIGAFAGLRTEEVCRLSWQEIDLKEARIDVGAKVAKTAAYRYVPIRDNLRAWIEPHMEKRGLIYGSTLHKKATKYRNQLRNGIEEIEPLEWKHNGLRHSFASYALAETENAGQVATWMGHDSTKTIFKHYRERVTKENAEKWFTVFPK